MSNIKETIKELEDSLKYELAGNQSYCFIQSDLIYKTIKMLQSLTQEVSTNAEEILKKSFIKNIKSKYPILDDFDKAKGENGYDWIYEAMQEYAAQINAELQKEHDRYKELFYDTSVELDNTKEELKVLQQSNAEAMRERAIKFARYYISNKSIIDFNKDNDEEVYDECLKTLNTK